MENHGWRIYNHSLASARAPHECPDIEALNDKAFWRSFEGDPLFAVWTTDYDCARETQWWYCICDKPFDITALKSKRRNTVRNGLKYCTVAVCDPLDHEDELFEIHNDAQNSYSAVNSSPASKERFHNSLVSFSEEPSIQIFICFLKETGAAAGYAVVRDHGSYAAFQSQKAKPEYEKYQVNAALVHAILEHYSERLSGSFYICDGSRNINHITSFQDYLEKYFGFRKAYCKLNIRYKRYMKAVVYLLYPFKGLLRRLDSRRAFHLINGVLKLESVRRSCHE